MLSTQPHILSLAILTMALLWNGVAAQAAKTAQMAGDCSIPPVAIRIVDESTGTQISGEALPSLPDSLFKEFIIATTTHLASKLAHFTPGCQSSTGPVDLSLLFIYRPLITPAGKARVAPGPEPRRPPEAFHLDSPWVQLTISRSPKPTIHAVFLWDERQVLLDQALLAGASLPSPPAPQSLSDQVFERYVQDYADSVLLAPSPEERARAQEAIAARIPADVLWLFRHAWQSTFAPFSMEARHALGLTLKRAAPAYIAMVEALVDRGLAATGQEERYRNLLELHGIVDVSAYRIDSIH
jgi:hypothetical protein